MNYKWNPWDFATHVARVYDRQGESPEQGENTEEGRGWGQEEREGGAPPPPHRPAPPSFAAPSLFAPDRSRMPCRVLFAFSSFPNRAKTE